MPTNSYVEAAVEVLRDARRPLTTREMTDEALRRGLIPTAGKTPQNSMSARLYVAVRNNPEGEALGITLEAASAWLAKGLHAAGVLLRETGGQRTYWLPGVGHFALYVDRPGRPPLIGGPLGPLHRELEIRIKPQARTRGLPRLRAPGTAPAQHT